MSVFNKKTEKGKEEIVSKKMTRNQTKKTVFSIVLILAIGIIVFAFIYSRGSFNNNSPTAEYYQAQAAVTQGNVYYMQKQYDTAITYYNQAIGLDPNCEAAYAARGAAYLSEGSNNSSMYSLAIDDCNIAIGLNQNNGYAYYIRGYTYYKIGQDDLAISDLNKAVQLSDDQTIVQASQKILVEKLGQPIPTNSNNQPPPTIQSGPITQGTTSYLGMFTYRYKVYEKDKNGHLIQGSDWITRALRITITTGAKTTSAGYIIQPITSVQCDDPDFGTGIGGVVPLESSAMVLPADPLHPSLAGEAIVIMFPNGDSIVTIPGCLHMSTDGRTIENCLTSTLFPSIGSTWGATVSSVTSHLHYLYPNEAVLGGTAGIEFVSWNFLESAY